MRDITLFHELLNKRGSRFGMRFGPLIEPEALQGDPATTATALRDYVSYDMAGDPHTPFRMTI